jgi:hypothetical protein
LNHFEVSERLRTLQNYHITSPFVMISS